MASKNKYHPLPGYIIAKPLVDETTPEGFALPETMSDKDSSGVVLAVGDPWLFREGDKEYLINPRVKVGDKIIFKNMGYQRYMGEDGKMLYLLKFHDDVVYNDVMVIID